MAHWTERYVGRRWEAGRYECIDLALEVSSREFGARPRLPPYAAGRGAREAQVAALGSVLADPVPAPRDGDLALMAPRGSSRGGHHIGVAALIEGAPHVLHCAEGAGACLHPVHALPAHGWELRGWHRWRPAP